MTPDQHRCPDELDHADLDVAIQRVSIAVRNRRLTMEYVAGETLAVVAARYGVSLQRANQIANRLVQRTMGYTWTAAALRREGGDLARKFRRLVHEPRRAFKGVAATPEEFHFELLAEYRVIT